MSKKASPTIRKVVKKVKGHSYVRFEVDAGLIDGKRHRPNFATKRQAQVYAKQLQVKPLMRRTRSSLSALSFSGPTPKAGRLRTVTWTS